MMKTKLMKVLYSTRSRQNPGCWPASIYIETPKISMEGKWLEALGFHIGDAIEVSYEDNCIRITPAPKPAMVCEPQTEYAATPAKKSRKKQPAQ
ncbi:MAG: SymE family type I addiction module toxin [Monoglobales bacterium]